MRIAVIAGLLFFGCSTDFPDDYSLLDRLRLLGVLSDPAEVAAGQQVTLTAYAFANSGSPPSDGGSASDIHYDWAACTLAPIPGSGTINPACVSTDIADFLIPIGANPSVSATFASIPTDSLGDPDGTGGVYLPIRVRLTAGAESVDGIYRMRVAGGPNPPNQNPAFASVNLVSGATPTPLEETSPPAVSAKDKLTLRAVFAEGSAETYAAPQPDGTTKATVETLGASWFSTAGTIGIGSTSDGGDTTLTLDKHLPASGGAIFVYVIGRDERGGVCYAHRALTLR